VSSTSEVPSVERTHVLAPVVINAVQARVALPCTTPPRQPLPPPSHNKENADPQNTDVNASPNNNSIAVPCSTERLMALRIVETFAVGEAQAKRAYKLFALGKELWLTLPKFHSPDPKPCTTKEELDQEQKQFGRALVNLADECIIGRIGKNDERSYSMYYKKV
jgi:hypothetical protein